MMPNLKVLRLALIVGLILTTGAGTAEAQRTYDPHFSIGGRGGVTFSSMNFSPSIRQSMPIGATFGATVRYTEEKCFGLIAELNVTQRGWEEDFQESPFRFRRMLTYLELPVLTHIYFGGNRFKGFINLGPSVSLLLSDKRSGNFDYRDINSIPNFPSANRHVNQMSMDISNRFDYGITAGAGMELFVRRRHSVVLEARYYYGLGSVFPSAKKDEFSASRASAISVTIGYNFALK